MSIIKFKRPEWLILINDRDNRKGQYFIDESRDGTCMISIFAENWNQVEQLRSKAEKELKLKKL